MTQNNNDRSALERRIAVAFESVSRPQIPADVLPLSGHLTLEECEVALEGVTIAHESWAYYALPHLLISALHYPDSQIIGDTLIELDVEMIEEDGTFDPANSISRDFKRRHFANLSYTQRRAIADWLEYVSRNCAPLWREKFLKSALAYWSRSAG